MLAGYYRKNTVKYYKYTSIYIDKILIFTLSRRRGKGKREENI